MKRGLLALGASLCAFSAAQAALGPRYGDELTLATSPFGALLPRAAATPVERLALGLVDETLVRVDAAGPRASLAASWTPASGEREWSVSLDSQARFHDDSALAASDVVASLRRFLRADSSAAEALSLALEGGAAFRSGASSELPGLQAGGDGRVVLRLLRRSAGLFPALASPAAAVRSEGGSAAGPFAPVLEVPGRRLSARAHPGHVRGRPFLDRVLLVARVRDAAAEAGLTSDGEPGARLRLLLALDASRPPFDSASHRASVDGVIDRADLARRVTGGAPLFALSEPAPPAPERSAVRPIGASITLAVQEEVPPIASQRLVALLASLGLRAEVSVAAAAEVRRSDASARLLLFLPEVPDPGLQLREAAALAGASALLPLLESADAEPDPARRRALLEEAERKLLAERTLLPLASLPLAVAAPEGTHGLRFDAAGRLVVEDAWRSPR